MLKELAKKVIKTSKNYVPKGSRLTQEIIEKLNFKPTSDDEIYYCCAVTGHDIQSGPHYCGKIADFIAIVSDDEIVSVCKKHYRHL